MDTEYLFAHPIDSWHSKKNDPINAPEYKINGTLTYMPDLGINWNIGMRYIPEFDWAAGVHYGTIQSYTVFDAALGYNFNENYGVLFNHFNNNESYLHCNSC